MTIETDLQELVKLYSTFDQEKKCYTIFPDKPILLKVDEHFNRLINKILLADGPEKEKIDKNYRKLTLYLHPDRSPSFIPEVVWLEHNLSEGRNDGICFKTLSFCYEKLTTPEKFKEVKFSDINNKEEFKKWLETLKAGASTYTGRSLYGSLIGLLDQAAGYFDDVGQIKPRGLRALVAFIPVIFASYGAVIFSEQLFAVYALYFLMLKGGQYLERNSSLELQLLGKTLQEISVITATATTTLLVRLLEMTFWVSRQCFDMSLQIGSAILIPLLKSHPTAQHSTETDSTSNLCKDLILASTNLNEGMKFDTPELKLIAAPLESYLGLNAQQYLSSLRVGREKRLKVEAFLFTMRVLDKAPESLEVKLIEAKKELKKLKENKKVYIKGGNTALAVDQADNVISFLNDDPASMQLVLT